MKLKHLLTINRCRTLTNTLKSTIHHNNAHTSSPHSIITNYTTPISTFTRNLHSELQTIPIVSDDEEETNHTGSEFLSRFVWIMRGKLKEAYPDVDKQTMDGMLMIITEKVIEEVTRGGVDEMIKDGMGSNSDDFSQELWKTVWEVCNSVLEDMGKERKKEAMKVYLQSSDVKEMCRFASEVGVRGNMLREFRFKWAEEKMEEAEIYQSVEAMREKARLPEDEEKGVEGEVSAEDGERKGEEEEEGGDEEEMDETANLRKEMIKNVLDVGTQVKPRREKMKFKIYGLDLSGKKWDEVAHKIHEAERLISPEEPKPITGKCKLVTEKILHLREGDDPSTLLTEWIELLQPGRVDWFSLLDEFREANARLYLKVAELILDEDSFQADIRDYSKLIDAHAREDRTDDAERILQKMAENNIQPDMLVSTTLLHMYSKAGNIARAKEVYEQLKSQGFRPDTRVYRSMIFVYIKAGDANEAEALLRQMESMDIKPSKEIYMALLRYYSERGLIDGASRISTLMQYGGFESTLESSTLLVEAFARAGNEMARREFDYMRNFGHKPDDRCAASLISMYEKKNSLEKAMDLLLELERDGFEAGLATNTVMLDWFCKLLLVEEAEEVYKRITETGETPPVKVQVSRCDMYSRVKDEKKALQVLGIVEGKKDPLGRDEFERLISGLLAGGLVKDALRLRALMEEKGFSVSEALNVALMASHTFRHHKPVAR